MLPVVEPATAFHEDAVARAYINALLAGHEPAMPEPSTLGRWAEVCTILSLDEGNAEEVRATIDTLIRMRKALGLAELLDMPVAREHLSVVPDKYACPPLPGDLHYPKGYSDRAWRLGAKYEAYSRLVSSEGYEEFHESCFIGMLSAEAARRIRIPFSRRDFTPLMIVLCAEPDAYKKTSTAVVAQDVLHAAGLGWMLQSGKITPQKLIYDMAGTLPKDYGELPPDVQERIKQRLAFCGQRGLIIGEFGKFVKQISNSSSSMADFQSLLLEMDDCKDMYDNGTIARGNEIIKKPYMAVLGCMTTVVAAAKAGSEFYGDGFWSRTVVSCPPSDTFIDDPFEIGEIPVPADLANAIRNWHYRLGVPNVEIESVSDEDGKPTGKYSVEIEELPEVTVTFGAGVHDAWKKYRSALKRLSAQLPIKDLKGSYGRFATKAMRVAALLASIENDNRIELWHWAKAQEICERWRRSLHEFYKQVNAAPAIETESSKLEDEIIRHMTRLNEKGKGPWFAANALRDYMPNRSRDEIENRLKMLERVGVCKKQKTAHAMKYRLVTPEDDMPVVEEKRPEEPGEEVYEL